jgi:myo-inositol-1(or 4)-monophosphatase
VDPLDGTTNFAHGFPMYAISIALQEKDTIVLGVVLNPVNEEEFRAVRGQGAFLNNEPLRVSKTRSLQDALLATGFPYDIHQDPDHVLLLFRKMILRARGIRRPGSAALDLCYVAAGGFDGFWEEKLHPWDTAAGALIVEEAGGVVTSFSGDAYDPRDKTIVAGNPYVHEAMLEILSSS